MCHSNTINSMLVLSDHTCFAAGQFADPQHSDFELSGAFFDATIHCIAA